MHAARQARPRTSSAALPPWIAPECAGQPLWMTARRAGSRSATFPHRGTEPRSRSLHGAQDAERCARRVHGARTTWRPPLLQVALDRALGADVGGVGVLAGVATGPALAQQVPALVELDLDVVEAGLLVLVEAFAGGLALEGVLLFDQGADAVENLPVVHGAHSTASAGVRAGQDDRGSGMRTGPSSWPPWWRRGSARSPPSRPGRPARGRRGRGAATASASSATAPPPAGARPGR